MFESPSPLSMGSRSNWGFPRSRKFEAWRLENRGHSGDTKSGFILAQRPVDPPIFIPLTPEDPEAAQEASTLESGSSLGWTRNGVLSFHSYRTPRL